MQDASESRRVGVASVKPGPRMPLPDRHHFTLFEKLTLPHPKVLIGTTTALWSAVPRDPCQSCGNRPLRDYEYCIRCDRWGYDYLDVPAPRAAPEVIQYVERPVPLLDMRDRLIVRRYLRAS